MERAKMVKLMEYMYPLPNQLEHIQYTDDSVKLASTEKHMLSREKERLDYTMCMYCAVHMHCLRGVTTHYIAVHLCTQITRLIGNATAYFGKLATKIRMIFFLHFSNFLRIDFIFQIFFFISVFVLNENATSIEKIGKNHVPRWIEHICIYDMSFV